MMEAIDLRLYFAVVDLEGKTLNSDKVADAHAALDRQILTDGFSADEARDPEITVRSCHWHSRLGYVMIASVLPMRQESEEEQAK